MAHDVPQLMKMTQAQLDELFTNSAAGEIPNGEAEGTAIIAAGSTSPRTSRPSSTTSPGRGRSSTRRRAC